MKTPTFLVVGVPKCGATQSTGQRKVQGKNTVELRRFVKQSKKTKGVFSVVKNPRV